MSSERTPEGLLVIDKPTGVTSFDVIRVLREPLGTRALGHTGTLDPNATGVLCICAGWGLKLQRFLADDVKVYRTQVRLGEATETDDAEGTVINVRPVSATRADIEQALSGFVGVIDQVPPAFSAVRQGGERAYKKARRGERVALPPRRVRVDRIEIEAIDGTLLQMLITCGRGTYIRSIARDLGSRLGCGAHVHTLRRLASGPFAIEQAVPLDDLVQRLRAGESPPFVSPLAMLAHLPLVRLREPTLERLTSGQVVRLETAPERDGSNRLVRVGDGGGRLMAVAQLDWVSGGQVVARPIKVRPVTNR